MMIPLFMKPLPLLCWLAPVQYGVNIWLVCYAGPATLYIGKVGKDIDETKQLDMVGVETAPWSCRYEDIKNIYSCDKTMTSDVLKVQRFLVVKKWPIDYGAKCRDVAVHICKHPQGTVAPWQGGAGSCIAGCQR